MKWKLCGIAVLGMGFFGLGWLYLEEQLAGVIQAPSSVTPPEFFRFPVQGHTFFNYTLQGGAVDCGSSAKIRQLNSVKVTSSILFQFSPLVDSHVARMFATRVKLEPWFVVSPFQVSCLFDSHTTVFTCVLRVWLRLSLWQDRSKAIVNRFQDSYFYKMQLDEQLRYIPNSGHVIAIPSPVQEPYFTGPEDPRLIPINGSIFIDFVNGHFHFGKSETQRCQFLWSVGESTLWNVRVSDFELESVEKNWTPFLVNDSLRFIYRYLPYMVVLTCDLSSSGEPTAECKVFGKLSNARHSPTSTMMLRGGSPAIHYYGEYYLALTHTLEDGIDGREYATQLTLIDVRGMRIVFVSSPIFIDPAKMLSVKRAEANLANPFLYARSLHLESADSLVMAAGLNDAESYLVRLEGFQPLLREAIAADSKVACSGLSTQLETWLLHRSGAELRFHFKNRNAALAP